MRDYQIHHFNEISSTNRYALEHLQSLDHETIILADRQLKGYGRFQRSWFSPDSGNIYMSIVLKPELNPEHFIYLSNLTQFMSLVICEVMKTYSVDAEIKWPNDVLVGRFKIAGLLSETCIQKDWLRGYILGAGINLNMSVRDLKKIDQPATSLNMITGGAVDRDVFLSRLLKLFFKGYPELLKQGFRCIQDVYCQKSRFLNKYISISAQGRKMEGIAAGFTDDGSLILQSNQKKIIISAGDVAC